MKTSAYIVVLVGCIGWGQQAAGGIMTVQHLYPGLGDVEFQSSFTVGAGVDLATFHPNAYRDLDVTPTASGFTFAVGMNSSLTFHNVAGNALRLIDTDDLFAPIFSVVIVSTNIDGFDATRVSFNAESTTLRFAGLTVDSNSEVLISINSVPEPSSLVLSSWCLATVGLALAVRRGLSRRRVLDA